MIINQIQIQTTSVCNCRCIMCPYGESWMTTPEGTGYMTDDTYKKIIKEIKDEPTIFRGKFVPYLANEPFADKNLLDRIEYAINELPRMNLYLSSNMGLLNEKKIDRLYELYKKINFRGEFTISHHGINRESVIETMKMNNYDICLENIIYFIKKFDGKLKIRIHSLFKSYDDEFDLFDRNEIDSYWDKIINKYSLPTKNLTNPKHQRIVSRGGNVKLLKVIDRDDDINRCVYVTRRWVHILWNGDITLCCMSPYKHEATLGNINEDTFDNIFKSDKYREIVKNVIYLKNSPKDFICRRCEVRER